MTITGPDARSAAPGQAVVDAAMLVLERMGLTPADLLAAPAARPPAPTFAEYIPVVSALVSDGCRRAYGSYWNRVTEQWGSRRIDEPTPSEIRQLVQHVRANVVPRRNSRGGRSAAEHLIAALRCMYKHAEEDGLITRRENPARKVDKPRRLPSTRRAVADKRLAEINHAAATTGDDPELDTLLLRLHTETACRRGGALALRPQDLDPEQCLILLREKGETVRWQPVSPTLMTALLGHAGERHAPPDGQLLRYRNGRRITYRRYDHLWDRLGRYLPWVRAQQISMHWIRHTTLTWVERNFGYAVAKAYAGHTDTGSDAGATATYVRATTHEVAAALAALTGEPHPLATQERVVTPMAALTAGMNRPAPPRIWDQAVRPPPGPPDQPEGTGPPRSPPAPGPSGPGRCWSWPPRPRPRCGPAGSASRRRPGSGWSPRCRASCRPCTWTRPSPCPSAWRRTPRTRCAPGWPTEHSISDRTRRFAKWSAICSFALGMAGQVAYHLLAQAGAARAPWPVTMIVSCLPVLVLAMGTTLAHMLRADAAPGHGTRGPAANRSAARSRENGAGPYPDQTMSEETPPETGPRARTATVSRRDHRPGPRTRAPGQAETRQARLIASGLAAAGKPVSRRALRSEGIRGSNAALNALAREVNAELAGTSRAAPGLDGAAA